MATATQQQRHFNVHDPLHRLSVEQYNFALDLYNGQDGGDAAHTVITLSYQIEFGCICEVRHCDSEMETLNYGLCYLNYHGRIEGDWIV